MEFRILGPLEVEDQGRLLPAGGPAERHLLALLVCLANEAVPVERIIDELWGDDPPASARNMVQRYVSRLRRTMGDGAVQRLATVPGGYSLYVGDGELDSLLFTSMVDEARGLEDPDGASVLLRDAMDLWRGPPLVGVGDGRTVVVERVRLEEARLSALEDRIDCDLDFGRHHDVVPELESLTGQFPLRERLRAQLMLALYRSDRQAEALRCFTTYRLALGEETGLEPGPALVELEKRVLARSPDLDAPSAVAAFAPPTNLPYRITRFIGRKDEIGSLERQLNEHRLVTLVGTGGIGKTSLAVRVAAEVTGAFPDGVWLIDLASLADALLIGSTAAGVLNATARVREDPEDAVVRHLHNQTVLLVLDNCEHLIDGAAQFAERMLRSARNVRILATSREALSVAGESIMRVPPLEIPDVTQRDLAAIASSEAVELFVDRAQLLRPEFRILDTNAAAVADICRKLDGIPLAIELAAARLGTMAVELIAASVEDRYHLLTRGARTAPHRHQTLQAMVDWSHELLTGDEQVLLRRLAVFAGTFTADASASVCGFEPLSQTAVEDALEQLVDASLVIPPDAPADRFRMLETIREYARHHLDSCGETDQTMLRLGTYLVEAGPDTEDGVPGSDYGAWYRWRDDEQDNFRAALTWSLEATDADMASRLTIEFRNYLANRHLDGESTMWVNDVLDLLGEETSHRHVRLLMFAVAGEFYLGDRARALRMVRLLYREAEALEDESAMGFARLIESGSARSDGDMVTALERNTEALEHFHAAGGQRILHTLMLRSLYLTQIGRYRDARAAADQIVEEAGYRDRGDQRWARATRNIVGAIVAMYEDDLDEAERLLDIEDEYIHQFGADEIRGFVWARWGVALARGDSQAAYDAANDLAEATPETATPESLRDVENLLALLALNVSGPEAAAPHLLAALEYAFQDDSVIDNADVIVAVADAALAARDHDDATRLYAAATAIHERSGIVLAKWQQRRLDGSLEALHMTLGPDQFDALWSEGSALTPTEMLDLASDYLNRQCIPRVPGVVYDADSPENGGRSTVS